MPADRIHAAPHDRGGLIEALGPEDPGFFRNGPAQTPAMGRIVMLGQEIGDRPMGAGAGPCALAAEFIKDPAARDMDPHFAIGMGFNSDRHEVSGRAMGMARKIADVKWQITKTRYKRKG